MFLQNTFQGLLAVDWIIRIRVVGLKKRRIASILFFCVSQVIFINVFEFTFYGLLAVDWIIRIRWLD